MEQIFDEETLMMLFDELGLDFDAWITDSGYTAEWSDQQIYSALPEDIIAALGDFGIEASWMHEGF